MTIKSGLPYNLPAVNSGNDESNYIKALLLIILSLTSFNTVEAADKASVSLDVKAFNIWVEEFRQEALERGMKASVLDSALDGIKPIDRIIELDRKQPEGTITFREYIKRVVSGSRVRNGKRLLKENEIILKEVAKKYGVQPRFIVALWGIETDFGRNMGSFYVPEALATLAFEGRRSEFFRKELFNAIRIIEDGHISTLHMKGSWAGAMGQTQFMPSSFNNFAVDYNGDGHKDIWKSKPDIFASIANYLSKSGWDDSLTWGRKVKIPRNFGMAMSNIKKERLLKEWQSLGVRKADGGDLPTRTVMASLVIPGDNREDAYLVYSNYKNILKWNRSLYFATAVGLLSDAIGGR